MKNSVAKYSDGLRVAPLRAGRSNWETAFALEGCEGRLPSL